jgi:ABC-2 type transport system ATP-binding protein
VIEVADFHKVYRETVAVAGLSFQLAAGSVLALLGPNGAGKTTTLRAIAGILPPTQGRLSVAGHDVVAEPVAAKRQLAYVPDDPKLFDTLTVWEHLEFIAAAYEVADYEPKARELLAQLELLDKRDVLAQELSRGMRQKAAIACAYLHDPKAILLDEPITGLDPQGIRTMKNSVQERARAGAAVIVSSHLLSLVEDICTHVLILDRGKQLLFGTMDEARERFAASGIPATLEDVFFQATQISSIPDAPDGKGTDAFSDAKQPEK